MDVSKDTKILKIYLDQCFRNTSFPKLILEEIAKGFASYGCSFVYNSFGLVRPISEMVIMIM